MVSTLHRCPYDNSTISSVNKLKIIWRLFFFLSFIFFSFTFLFNLFCFSSLCQRVLLWTLIFSHRERESRRSPVVRGGRVVRWCWVNFQCRGVPLIWIIVGQGPTALAVGAGWVCLDIFLSSIFSLFFLPLWEMGRYRLKYCHKGPANPK